MQFQNYNDPYIKIKLQFNLLKKIKCISHRHNGGC